MIVVPKKNRGKHRILTINCNFEIWQKKKNAGAKQIQPKPMLIIYKKGKINYKSENNTKISNNNERCPMY